MGMDVFGRDPQAESGRYFAASVWSWRPIHALICELCSDLFSYELIDAMGRNDGQGPDDPDDCSEMAKRFEEWLANSNDGFSLPNNPLRCTEDGRLLSDAELADPNIRSYPLYYATRECIAEWTEFLRHCGGFEVW